MKDFYYILGTEPNATSIEIREAYKKLSKKFHPDLNQNDYYFESHFKEISEAYNTLNDPYKRREYDAAIKKTGPFLAEAKIPKRLPIPKRVHIDIAFTIVLMGITSLFGYYVYHAINGTRRPKTVSVIAAVPPPVIKHHKRKHKIKTAMQAADIANTDIKTAQPTPVIAKTIVKQAIPNPDAAIVTKTTLPPVQTSTPSPVQLPSNLYSAYIRANATGVVYLRSADNYSSDVVVNIPNNAKVTVLEQGKTFCKVSFNNETGYVPKWALLTK